MWNGPMSKGGRGTRWQATLGRSHRKQRRGEVARQASLQGECAAGGSPDMDFDCWVIERTKKAQPLDVIHVEVGEKDVNPSGRRRDLCAQSTDAGASVEREHGAVFRTHFDCWGVSPVTDCLGSGRRG
jgi:hypothetical protein